MGKNNNLVVIGLGHKTSNYSNSVSSFIKDYCTHFRCYQLNLLQKLKWETDHTAMFIDRYHGKTDDTIRIIYKEEEIFKGPITPLFKRNPSDQTAFDQWVSDSWEKARFWYESSFSWNPSLRKVNSTFQQLYGHEEEYIAPMLQFWAHFRGPGYGAKQLIKQISHIPGVEACGNCGNVILTRRSRKEPIGVFTERTCSCGFTSSTLLPDSDEPSQYHPIAVQNPIILIIDNVRFEEDIELVRNLGGILWKLDRYKDPAYLYPAEPVNNVKPTHLLEKSLELSTAWDRIITFSTKEQMRGCVDKEIMKTIFPNEKE